MRFITLLACLFMFGCATIDPNDVIIDRECTLKNSIPNIHDEII